MKPADGVRIKVTKNGPYTLAGEIPVRDRVIVADENGESIAWGEGRQYPGHERCALCRCGASASKPLCDGSHLDVGFDGTETASNAPYDEQAEDIVGPSLILKDVSALCADARFCHRSGGAWNRVKADDDASREIVVHEAGLCPSGRYVAVDAVTSEVLEPDLEPAIGLVEDPAMSCIGPIWVEGGIPIESADGTEYEARNRVTLCRCGGSHNKPFCDGSHITVGIKIDH